MANLHELGNRLIRVVVVRSVSIASVKFDDGLGAVRKWGLLRYAQIKTAYHHYG